MPDKPTVDELQQLPIVKTGEQVLAESLTNKPSDYKDTKQRMDRMAEITAIALTSLYRAAEAGNVTCRNAVIEIEKILIK